MANRFGIIQDDSKGINHDVKKKREERVVLANPT